MRGWTAGSRIVGALLVVAVVVGTPSPARAVASDALPFAVVDKAAARLTVYRPDGTVAGISPVLIGRTPGDTSAPGVGLRTQQGRLTAADLTTPAGRFASEPGRNRDGEAIVWVDYDAAFAIHRLRPGAQYVQRSRRLSSPRPEDRRASAGCVVVPGEFFDAVVMRWLGRGPGVVIVLPESAPTPPMLTAAAR